MKNILIISLLSQISFCVWAQAPVTEINTVGSTAIISNAENHALYSRSRFIPVYSVVDGTNPTANQRQSAIEGRVDGAASNTANQYVGVAGYAREGGPPPQPGSEPFPYDIGVYGSGKKGVWGLSYSNYGHGVYGEGYYGVMGSSRSFANGVGILGESTGSAAILGVGYNGAYAARLFGGKTYIEHLSIGPVANINGFTYTLDVGGRMLLRSGGSDMNSAGVWFNNNANNSLRAFIGMRIDNELGFYSPALDQWMMRFNVTTGTICTASVISLCSDQRLKTNFSPLQNSLGKLSQLRGYHYDWIKKTNAGLQTGFIAQEVQKIFPELVETDSEGYLSVNYIGLIPHLLEAIKDLKHQVETHRTTGETLLELNKDLKATNDKNEARLNAIESVLKQLTTPSETAGK